MSEEPPKYAAIRIAFREREEAKRRYRQENTQVANLIAHGFQEYMGMPRHYKHEKDGTLSYRSYVPLYRVEDDGSYSEVPHFSDAVTHCSDGTFVFCLGIVLEPKENAYHKQVLQAKVECERKDGAVLVTIVGESVTCSFDGLESPDIEKVHHLLHGLLNEWLTSRWGETEAKRPFGFQLR